MLADTDAIKTGPSKNICRCQLGEEGGRLITGGGRGGGLFLCLVSLMSLTRFYNLKEEL